MGLSALRRAGPGGMNFPSTVNSRHKKMGLQKGKERRELTFTGGLALC